MEAVGIDLGTTNTRIACHTGDVKATTIDLIENKNGHFDIPSIIALVDDKIVAGDEASIQAKTDPESVLYNVKCLLSKQVYSLDKINEITKNPKVSIQSDKIKFGTKSYSPSQLIEPLFKIHLQTFIHKKGTNPKSVTIALPVYFTKQERNAVEQAAKNAGFTGVKTVNESTAAIAAYQKEFNTKDGKYLVVNCSAIATEATYVIVKGAKYETKGTAVLVGHSGNALNHQISKSLFAELGNKKNEEIIKKDMRSMRTIDQTIEEQKLSISKSTDKLVHFFTPTLKQGISLKKDISKQNFESLADELADDIKTPIDDLFDKLEISGDDIDYVVLTGGTTNIPLFREKILSECDKDVDDANIFSDPTRVIAIGAAILDERSVNKQTYTDADIVLKPIISEVIIPEHPNKDVAIKVSGGSDTYMKLFGHEVSAGTKKAYVFRTVNKNQKTADFTVCTKPLDGLKWEEKFTLQVDDLPKADYVDLRLVFEFNSNEDVFVKAGVRGTGKYVTKRFSF